MKVLVVVAHPDLQKSVINATWCKALESCDDVTIRDLYSLYPDEKIDVKREQLEIERNQRIVFQYPMYWYAAPSLMKKYMDEVFTFGWAFGPGGDKMEGKELATAVSCGSPEAAFVKGGQQCHTLREYLYYMDGIATFLRADYIGTWAFHDTYNPEALKELTNNTKNYIAWVTTPREKM